MMKRMHVFVIYLTMVIILSNILLTANAKIAVDQSQTFAPAILATFDQGGIAQSFMQAANNIAGAKIRLGQGLLATDTITISLYDALPNAGGQLIISGTTNKIYRNFAEVYWAPTAIKPNTTYFLVFTSTNQDIAIYGFEITDNANYTRGNAYANSNFDSFLKYDYAFQTFADDAFGLPPATNVNIPPVVKAGTNTTINEGDSFVSIGSFTDPDLDTWTCTVDYGDGSGSQPLALASDKTFALSHPYIENGIYMATVKVKDDDGGVGSYTKTITVNNVAPTANANGPYTANEGSPIIFNGTVVDPGVLDVFTYDWDLNNDGVFETTGQNVQYTWSDDYNGQIVLRTTDDDGGIGYAKSSVTVLNVPPIVGAESNQIIKATMAKEIIVKEADVVAFSGSFIDPGTDSWTILWDFGDGGNSTGTLTPSHIYADNGVYGVILTVTDDDGGIDSNEFTVVVNNVAPIVEVGNNQVVTAGNLVTFSGFFTDPGWLDTHTANWDFGDGTMKGVVKEENIQPNSTATIPGSHTFFTAGDYIVTLKVMDRDGDEGKDALKITVKSITTTNVKFTPQTINKNESNGDSKVMVKGSLPAGYAVKDIDPFTVKLNGVVPAITDSKSGFVKPADDAKEFMFKFDRSKVEAILPFGDAVVVTITGKVKYNNGTDIGMASFEGKNTIKVMDLGKMRAAPGAEMTTTVLAPYPQPCNPEVWMPFKLAQNVKVTISIYNMFGCMIRSLDLGERPSGTYVTKDKAGYWDGRNEVGEQLPSGIYFYTIKAGKFSMTKKIVILK